MEKYLNENPTKILKFFEEEFVEKYGNNPNLEFNILFALQSAVCCYSAILIFAEKKEYSKVKPNIKLPQAEFLYELSGFEIKSLKTKTDDELKALFEKFEVEKDFSFNKGVNKNRTNGLFKMSFEPVVAPKIEEFKLKFSLNITFEKQPQTELKTDDAVLKRDYENLSKHLLNIVFDTLKIKNTNWKRESINFVPDYFNILSNSLTKELRGNLPSSQTYFNDLSLEVLDLIIYIYLEKSKEISENEDKIIISNDDILNLRKVKKAVNSKGVQGGYCEKQRLEIDTEIKKLASFNFECGNLFSITKFRKSAQGKGKFYYDIKMDEFIKKELKSEQNIRKIPSILYHYHPKRQMFEKRLGYFLWLGGKRKRNLLVEDLMKFVVKKAFVERPNKVRDEFEEAMDRLVSDKIIKSWQYNNFVEEILDKKYWYDTWLKQKILIV